MLKIVLQFGMFAIPSVIALFIWNKKQSVDFVIRLKQFAICFFCINFSTYLASFVRGIKRLSFQNMSYSYCIKWLAVSVGFAICYSLGAPYIQKCFDKKNRAWQAIIVLLTQSVVIAICFLLWCSTEYKNVDVTGLMRPGEHTYIDDAGMWYIDEDSGYQSKDIILSGPYISLEKGSYTVTVEYDSHKTQFFQVKSEHHSGSLESEESTFLGGGLNNVEKQISGLTVNWMIWTFRSDIPARGTSGLRIYGYSKIILCT